MAKRVLVFGASGFLGTYLTAYLTAMGHTITGTYRDHPNPDLIHLDLLDPEELRKVIADAAPDVVVFLSGTKDVTRCEKNPAHAIDLNVQLVRNFIDACQNVGCHPPTLFFSTDYVFDGLKGNYRKEDPVGARTVYGLTNLLAERLLQVSRFPCLILRVSAVMGKKGGFFQWLSDKLDRNEKVELFDNTYFSPTSIGRLCRFVHAVIDEGIRGVSISHLSDGYRMSRFEFGHAVTRGLGKPASLLISSSADFRTSTFQPDLSLLPDGMSHFRSLDSWNELEDIF